jgi:DNA ligase (NAD+)
LYDLKKDDIRRLEGFKDLSTQNLLKGIEQSKQALFESVLFAIGIRYVGQTVATKLARHFKNIDNLMSASYDELLQAPEVGEKIAQSVVEFFNNPDGRVEVERLKKAGLNFVVKETEPKKVSNVLDDKSFVISGVFQKYQRDELKDIVLENGGRVLSSVSGKLDYLLAGENMGPAKREKAEKLGVKIISENEFDDLINGNSL